MNDPSAAVTKARADTADGNETASLPRRPPLDADGMERPAFLLDFPEDPALELLIAAFEAGNYARIRNGAELLAQRTDSAAVRDAALELRRRIEPDPLAKYLVGLSVVLLVVLTVWAYHAGSH
jgi:hypothetical protein